MIGELLHTLLEVLGGLILGMVRFAFASPGQFLAFASSLAWLHLRGAALAKAGKISSANTLVAFAALVYLVKHPREVGWIANAALTVIALGAVWIAWEVIPYVRPSVLAVLGGGVATLVIVYAAGLNGPGEISLDKMKAELRRRRRREATSDGVNAVLGGLDGHVEVLSYTRDDGGAWSADLRLADGVTFDALEEAARTQRLGGAINNHSLELGLTPEVMGTVVRATQGEGEGRATIHGLLGNPFARTITWPGLAGGPDLLEEATT